MHSITRRQLRVLRATLLDAVIDPPAPSDAGERWFNLDVHRFDRDDLRAEAQRLRLRLLLTPAVERGHWPSIWLADRLARIEELLRADRTAAGWARMRRP